MINYYNNRFMIDTNKINLNIQILNNLILVK